MKHTIIHNDDGTITITKTVTPCQADNCDRPSHCRNLCSYHYAKQISERKGKHCSKPDCNNQPFRRTLCQTCYQKQLTAERNG